MQPAKSRLCRVTRDGSVPLKPSSIGARESGAEPVGVTFFLDAVRRRPETPILAIQRSKPSVFECYRVFVVVPLPLLARFAFELQTIQHVAFRCGTFIREGSRVDSY